jgi:hypothetical protein
LRGSLAEIFSDAAFAPAAEKSNENQRSLHQTYSSMNAMKSGASAHWMCSFMNAISVSPNRGSYSLPPGPWVMLVF